LHRPAPAARDSYLNAKAIVAALGTGADAVHPGYGFLAESPELAVLCPEHKVTFVGPSADQIRAMGNKVAARQFAARHGVPTVPGSERVASAEAAAAIAERIGFPLMLKAAAGGRRARHEDRRTGGRPAPPLHRRRRRRGARERIRQAGAALARSSSSIAMLASSISSR
jgi:hypothetical protein